MKTQELYLGWGMIVVSVLCNAVGAFVIKLKLNELGPITVHPIGTFIEYLFLMLKSKLVVGGILLFCASPVFFAIALSRMEVTVAYPAVVVLNFVVLLALAVLFIGERVTFNKAVGIALALISVYFLYKK